MMNNKQIKNKATIKLTILSTINCSKSLRIHLSNKLGRRLGRRHSNSIPIRVVILRSLREFHKLIKFLLIPKRSSSMINGVSKVSKMEDLQTVKEWEVFPIYLIERILDPERWNRSLLKYKSLLRKYSLE